jgi:hypothetical protein
MSSHGVPPAADHGRGGSGLDAVHRGDGRGDARRLRDGGDRRARRGRAIRGCFACYGYSEAAEPVVEYPESGAVSAQGTGSRSGRVRPAASGSGAERSDEDHYRIFESLTVISKW